MNPTQIAALRAQGVPWRHIGTQLGVSATKAYTALRGTVLNPQRLGHRKWLIWQGKLGPHRRLKIMCFINGLGTHQGGTGMETFLMTKRLAMEATTSRSPVKQLQALDIYLISRIEEQ